VNPDWQVNHVYFSDLLGKHHPRLRSRLDSLLTETGAVVGTIHDTKDIWCRDFMPVQVGEDAFCQFLYDPDYLQGYDHLRTPAAACRVKATAHYRNVPLILDGGNVVPARTKGILTD
jgi:hypothetical protein